MTDHQANEFHLERLVQIVHECDHHALPGLSLRDHHMVLAVKQEFDGLMRLLAWPARG